MTALTLCLAGAACGTTPAPPPPTAPIDVPPEAPPPAWMLEPRDDTDRALLARLLDPQDDVRAAAVAEWDAVRGPTWRLVYGSPREAWPSRSGEERDVWEKDDDSQPVDPEHAVRLLFENRTRALTRGLAVALREGDAPTRAAAASSMGAMQLPTGRRLTAALADTAPEVRLAAAQALSLLQRSEARFPECYVALTKHLEDPDWRVREAVLIGMRCYYDDDAKGDAWGVRMGMARLLASTRDDHPEVRVAALSMIDAAQEWTSHAADVPGIFAEALGDADPAVRSRAASFFADEAQWNDADPFPEAVVETLRGLLTDPAPNVRWSAAGAVWRRTKSPTGVVPVLSEQVAQSRGLDLVEPLRLLAEIGPDADEAVPSILSVLTEDTYGRHYSYGTEALDALFAIGAPTATTLPLLEKMLADDDPARRRKAAYAVATLDGDDAARDAVLARRLARETDARVRQAIHAARGAIGAGGEPLLADLVAGLRASDDDERAGALQGWQALGRGAASASSAALDALLSGGSGDWLPDQARVVLAAVGGASHRLNCFSWPGEPQGWVSERFLSRGPLGPEDAAAAPALIAAFDARPLEVGRALAEIGPAAKGVLPDLRPRLVGPPSEQRIAAAEAVLAIGGDDAVALAVLVDAVETCAARPEDKSEDDLGPAAAWALSRGGDAARPAIPALWKAAEREGWDLQTAAVCALARLGNGVRVGAVVGRIEHHIPTPPVELVETLGALGRAAAPAASALERIATEWGRETHKESAFEASRAAIRALGQIGPGAASALPSLRKMRRNALFRTTADEAIRRIEAR